jgi:hypothetical protein
MLTAQQRASLVLNTGLQIRPVNVLSETAGVETRS